MVDQVLFYVFVALLGVGALLFLLWNLYVLIEPRMGEMRRDIYESKLAADKAAMRRDWERRVRADRS